jgi:hypothetical protein
MVNYKYRFKTEEEYTIEWGYDWRYHIHHGWNNDMERFIGKDFMVVDINLINKIERGDNVRYSDGMGRREWFIREHHLILNIHKPSYKPKRIKRTI